MQKIKSLLIVLFTVICCSRISFASEEGKIIGVKIYEYSGNKEELVKTWKDIGINTVFASAELLSDADFKKYTKENGGTPIPSIAFFHIPLQEFAVACTNQRAALFGTRSEAVCCADMNSGLFSAMKEQGDIMGIFCGHDHDNDYAVNWYNILLAYGRYSGDNTAYNHLKGNGGRVIELKEGTRTIHTWIRLTNGEMHQDTLFPKDYLR